VYIEKKKKLRVFAILVSLSLMFLGSSTVEAITFKYILQPYEDDILLCIDALGAISLQGNRREGELKKQLEQLGRYGYREGISLNKKRLRSEHTRRREVFKAMYSAFGQLIYNPHEPNQRKAHIPHFGWIDGKALNQRQKKNSELSRKEHLALNSKDTPFWVIDLGHISEKNLQGRLLTKQKEITKLVSNKEEFKINYPGLGWVSRNIIRKRIAVNQKKITEIRGQIQRGEYKVFLPKLGWVTRNILLDRIKKVDDTWNDTNKQFRVKQAKIYRYYLGWTDQKTLESSIQKISKNQKDLESSIKNGTFQAHLSGEGWTTRKKLDAKIAQNKKAQTQVIPGKYKVPVLGFGYLDRNQINQQFKRKGLNKQQKAALSRGINHIGAAVRIHLRVLQLMSGKLSEYQRTIGSHANPRKHALNIDLNRRKKILNEAFSKEKNYILKRLKRLKAYLQQSLALIPWKLPPLPPKKPLKITGYGLW